jgi:hypothetical protein
MIGREGKMEEGLDEERLFKLLGRNGGRKFVQYRRNVQSLLGLESIGIVNRHPCC